MESPGPVAGEEVGADVVVAWTLQPPSEPVKLRLARAAARGAAGETGDLRIGRLCPRCGGEGHGRPFFVGRRDLALSLSAASGVTAVAVTRGSPVGVDVEHLDDARFSEIADVLLHARETAARADELARTWVRKESVLKMRGVGMGADPRTLRLTGAGEPPELLEPRPAEHVWIEDLRLPPTLVGCAAVETARRPELTMLEVAPEALFR